jgi:aldehyde dehydrogenase (NAD+)
MRLMVLGGVAPGTRRSRGRDRRTQDEPGEQRVTPSSDATIKVIDSGTEETYFTVAEAQAADISRAVAAAREAFDNGPWPRLSHAERAGYLRAIGAELAKRGEDIGQIWPRQSGVLHTPSHSSAVWARK